MYSPELYHRLIDHSGYNGLTNVTLVGCWAHSRRGFDKALKALPAEKKDADVAAKRGLEFCNQLFAIERKLHDVSPEERHKIRLERSRPVVDAFRAWLYQKRPKVLPKSALGLAINYCINQWSKLEAFLQDGRLELDNTLVNALLSPL